MSFSGHGMEHINGSSALLIDSLVHDEEEERADPVLEAPLPRTHETPPGEVNPSAPPTNDPCGDSSYERTKSTDTHWQAYKVGLTPAIGGPVPGRGSDVIQI
jgi:hypothetical protein